MNEFEWMNIKIKKFAKTLVPKPYFDLLNIIPSNAIDIRG